MASGAAKVVRGSFLGTGADVDVRTVGFRPRTVRLFNIDGLATAEWVEGMADASMVKRITDGTMTVPTSGGVTPLSDGFRLGNDGDMNAADELVRYEATE